MTSHGPTTDASLSRPWRLLLGGLCLSLLLVGGCPSPPGPGDAGEATPEGGTDRQCTPPSAEAPQVTAVAYKGQVPKQPYILRFAIDWSDPDNDLKGGTYQFVVDGTPLSRRFLPDEESLTGASGQLELPLLLDPSMTQGKAQLDVKLTLWDSAGNDSNQPQMVVEVVR